MEIYGVSPRLINIRLHPIKSLDPISVTEARIGPAGGLEFDRAWALYTADNRWINGKRTPAMLRIRAAFAPFHTTKIPQKEYLVKSFLCNLKRSIITRANKSVEKIQYDDNYGIAFGVPDPSPA